MSDFQVEFAGQPTPMLNAPLEAINMSAAANDPELSEHLASVHWFCTRPRDLVRLSTHAQASRVARL